MGANVILFFFSLSEYLDKIYPYIFGFINEIKETNYMRKIIFNHIVLLFKNYIFKSSKDVDKEMFLRYRNVMDTIAR